MWPASQTVRQVKDIGQSQARASTEVKAYTKRDEEPQQCYFSLRTEISLDQNRSTDER